MSISSCWEDLSPADEQQDDLAPALGVVHAVAGSVVDAELEDPVAHRFGVSEVPSERDPSDAYVNTCSGIGIPKPFEPLDELFCLKYL